MARFCANCGATMEEGDKVCGQCGTPAIDLKANVINESNSKEINIDKAKATKIIKYALVIIILIVVGIIAVNIIRRHTGYNSVLAKMVKAIKEDDVNTLDEIASSASKDIYIFAYGDDYIENYDNALSKALDEFEDTVGEIKGISYEVVDVNEFSERRVKDIKDNLDYIYGIDTSSISKINKVELELTVKGSKKIEKYDVDQLYLIKESGKWKIYYGKIEF